MQREMSVHIDKPRSKRLLNLLGLEVELGKPVFLGVGMDIVLGGLDPSVHGCAWVDVLYTRSLRLWEHSGLCPSTIRTADRHRTGEWTGKTNNRGRNNVGAPRLTCVCRDELCCPVS